MLLSKRREQFSLYDLTTFKVTFTFPNKTHFHLVTQNNANFLRTNSINNSTSTERSLWKPLENRELCAKANLIIIRAYRSRNSRSIKTSASVCIFYFLPTRTLRRRGRKFKFYRRYVKLKRSSFSRYEKDQRHLPYDVVYANDALRSL